MSISASQYQREVQSAAQIRSGEFFEFYRRHRLWDFVRTENFNADQGVNSHHEHFGAVDVYSMNSIHWDKISSEKRHQYDHRVHHHSHNHASKEILEDYRQTIPQLPKWLPRTIAVKTTQVSSFQGDNLRGLIDGHIERFWNYSPEFCRVLGHETNGNEVKIYFEYPDLTLEQEIRIRQAEKRPFQEDLLWKLLINLTKAASRLNQAGQTLSDVRPSRVYYNNYQASVFPYGLAQEKDGDLATRFASNDTIFWSPEFCSELSVSNQQLRQSQTTRSVQSNESFQIGITVLSAGLLRNERELNLYTSRGQLDQNRLEEMLEDFGRLHQNDGRLLQFVLEEFFIRASRQSPQLTFPLFSTHEVHYHFLEAERFKPHLEAQFQQQQILGDRRNQFIQAHPQLNIGTDFWTRYPLHYHFDIKKLDYETNITRYQGTSSSQVITEQVKHSAHHHHQQQQHYPQQQVVNGSSYYRTSSPQRISNISHSGIRQYQ